MQQILMSLKAFLFRWTGVFLFFALVFVGWSLFLLVSVNNDQDEMASCVSMINRLNALEKTARDLDNVLSVNPDEADRGMISAQWLPARSRFDTARAAISARDPLYSLIRQPLTAADTILSGTDRFFSGPVYGSGDESLMSQINSARKSLSSVIDHINQGINQIRGRSRELSVGLSGKWTQLNVLVVVSCFLAVITAVLLSLYYSKLREHQSDKQKLVAAQNELSVINAQRNTILNNTIEQLSGIVAQLTLVTQQQTQALHEQSVALNQTTTTAQQISVTSQQSTQKAEMVADNAETSMNTTQRSKSSVDTAIGALSEIHRNSQTTMDHFRFLNEKMRLIETISVSVKDIAKKTNILALNAGIEAFKAGDLGKGLTVVANEVRALAERSQSAASEISELALEIQNAASVTQHSIQEGFSAVEHSVQDINAAGQLMEESLSALTENDTYAKEILVDHRQQAIGIDQLTQALDSISNVVKQIVGNTEQIQGTVEAAESLTAGLKKMLEETGEA